MIKLMDILSEKEDTDVKFRNEANSFFNKLYKIVKKTPGKLVKAGDKKWFLFGTEIDKKYNDLMIMFCPVRSDEFGYATFKGSIKVDLPILLPDGSLDYIDKSLKGHKTDFIHEFIHYLDEKRYKGDRKLTSFQALQSKGEKGYYNTPEEFNAYYQEGADKIWLTVKKMKGKSDKEKEKIFPKDYNKFLTKGTLKFFRDEFLYFMDKKYVKKFSKRIADLYKKVLEHLYD